MPSFFGGSLENTHTVPLIWIKNTKGLSSVNRLNVNKSLTVTFRFFNLITLLIFKSELSIKKIELGHT